jgi:hypothetical protein
MGANGPDSIPSLFRFAPIVIAAPLALCERIDQE